MSSSSSEAESPDIKPKNPVNVRPGPSREREESRPGPSEEKSEDENLREQTGTGEDEKAAEEGSRWRKLYNKTAFTFTSSRDSAAAAAAAKKAAAAEKLRATQESIIASKNAATEAAWAKKEAAQAAAIAKKEAAQAAAIARKEAAAAKMRETGEAVKSSTNNATEAVKGTSYSAATSVNSGFWGVVASVQKVNRKLSFQYQRLKGRYLSRNLWISMVNNLCDKNRLKAAVDPKSIIPGRAADKIYLIHFNDVANVESGDKDPVGGAARFLTAVKQHSEDTPLVIFSGNVFSPSMSMSECQKKILQ